MSATILTAADLKNAAAGGFIHEDVLDQIFNLDMQIPTPFLDAIGQSSFSHPYSEWTFDDLAAPDMANAVIDGADATGQDAKVGARVGNHAQISDKVVSVSERSEGVDSIGGSGGLAYQTGRRLQELRRDVEAIALSRQGSVADDGSATAGKTGGFSAWLKTNTDVGAGGADAGFDNGTKLVVAPTPGATRGLTGAILGDTIEKVYLKGGNITLAMSVPKVIKSLAKFLFTTPNAAVPTANIAGQGGRVNQTSQGYINVMVTDFGTTLELVPNRLMQQYDSADVDPDLDAAELLLIDPQHVQIAYLGGYKVQPLAKLGLSERRQLSVDWMVKVTREDAHGVVRDIDPTVAVAA
jgi:hypothetical protein